MKLKLVNIEYQIWGEYKGKYLGKIEYEDKKGAVVMTLDDKVSEALLLCIGETITRFSADAAKEIKQSIFQSIQEAKTPKAIEA